MITSNSISRLFLLILICSISLPTNSQDVHRYYAKKQIGIFTKESTGDVVNTIVAGKNFTIIYDETFKSISMNFLTDDNTIGSVQLKFIQNSTDPITGGTRENEMIMIDRNNTKWYVNFDPLNTKKLFMFPYDNKVINGLTYYLKIENIANVKNW